MQTRRNLLKSAGLVLASSPILPTVFSNAAFAQTSPSLQLPQSFLTSVTGTVVAMYHATKAKTITTNQLSLVAGKMDDFHMLLRDNGLIAKLEPKWSTRKPISQSTREMMIAQAVKIIPDFDANDVMGINFDTAATPPSTFEAALSGVAPALGRVKVYGPTIAAIALDAHIVRIQSGGGVGGGNGGTQGTCDWAEQAVWTGVAGALFGLEGILFASGELQAAAAIYVAVSAALNALAFYSVGC